MNSARLLGRDQHELGRVAAIAEGPACITLSRGGARKTYGYTDPNEDAACFALGGGGILAAVADGHFGARGAERAIETLLAEVAPRWTAATPAAVGRDAWTHVAYAALQRIHDSVLEQGRELESAPAPTTLSVALARPAEDLLLHASVGDSHVFLANDEEASDLGWATTGRRRAFYLGEPVAHHRIDAEISVVGCESLAGARALVLATDGLSERNIGVADPAAAVARAIASAADHPLELRPLEIAKAVAQAAVSAHRRNEAGDNIATAVLWLEEPIS